MVAQHMKGSGMMSVSRGVSRGRWTGFVASGDGPDFDSLGAVAVKLFPAAV